MAPQSLKKDAPELAGRGTGVDRRAQLIEAGIEIFTTKAYEDVSAQEIAARAGVAHGLLFHYFKDKRGFYFAVLERLLGDASEQFSGNTVEDPAKWLRKELDLFLDNIAGEAPIFAMLVHGSLGAEVEAQRIISRQAGAAADRVISKLAPERTSPLLLIGVTAWVASANELAADWLESGKAMSRRQVRTLLTGALNAALAAIAAVDSESSFDPARFAGA